MIIFFSPNLRNTLSLNEEESNHCCRVLRLKEGDTIRVVDGKGHLFICEITEARPKKVSVSIIEEQEEQKSRKCKITLIVAPTKNIGRIEWLLEKCVEIGVDRIILAYCKRSERKSVNPERLEKILISAMKQSLKASLPELIAFPSINEIMCDQRLPEGQRFMGYCYKDFPKKSFVKECRPNQDVTILIGPEGDFTPEEVDRAVDAGFVPVTFGDTRLRTETAALYAVEAVHILSDLSN